MKSHWKTSIVGVAKLLAALGFVVLKVTQGSPMTESDIGLITLALSGGLGNILSADAVVKSET